MRFLLIITMFFILITDYTDDFSKSNMLPIELSYKISFKKGLYIELGVTIFVFTKITKYTAPYEVYSNSFDLNEARFFLKFSFWDPASLYQR